MELTEEEKKLGITEDFIKKEQIIGEILSEISESISFLEESQKLLIISILEKKLIKIIHKL